MSRLRLLVACLLLSVACRAQTTAFDKVYAGCQKAVAALSGGSGSQSDMREAARLLKEAKWVKFYLSPTNSQKDLAIGSHLQFTEKYFTDLANNHVVKKKAAEYYAEERSGDGVRLCTKVIKKGTTVTYSFKCMGGQKLLVGAVAETNGLINLKVTAKKMGSNQAPIVRKENSNEYKGAASRKVSIDLPKGQYVVTIEVTNKYKKNRSCAIIAN